MLRLAAFLAVATALLCITTVSAQGPDIIYGDDPRKPVDTSDPALQCAVCKAVLTEAKKKLDGLGKKKQDEVEIVSVLKTVCKQDNFMVYDFIPPKMTQGCEAFMASFDDLAEDFFKQPKNKALGIEEYCKKVVKVCDGKSKKKDANKKGKSTSKKAKAKKAKKETKEKKAEL